MKQCPTCQSIVEAETECPICGETLTYVEPHAAHRERIAPGRYAVRYYVRESRIVCLLTVVVLVLLLTAEVRSLPLTIGALACCIGGLVLAFFARPLARWWRARWLRRDFETDVYRALALRTGKYELMAAALILALVQRLIR